jgi:Holliday junction resolvase
MNKKEKGARFEREIKHSLEKESVLVVRSSASSFPDLIVFGEKITLTEVKTGYIRSEDVKRMKNLLRAILQLQPQLVYFIEGQIISKDKVMTITPVQNHSLKTKVEFWAGETKIGES